MVCLQHHLKHFTYIISFNLFTNPLANVTTQDNGDTASPLSRQELPAGRARKKHGGGPPHIFRFPLLAQRIRTPLLLPRLGNHRRPCSVRVTFSRGLGCGRASGGHQGLVCLGPSFGLYCPPPGRKCGSASPSRALMGAHGPPGSDPGVARYGKELEGTGMRQGTDDISHSLAPIYA